MFASIFRCVGIVCDRLYLSQTVPEKLCRRLCIWSGAGLSSQGLGLMLNRYLISSTLSWNVGPIPTKNCNQNKSTIVTQTEMDRSEERRVPA